MERRVGGSCPSRQHFVKTRGAGIEFGNWPQIGRKERERKEACKSGGPVEEAWGGPGQGEGGNTVPRAERPVGC